MTASAVYRGTVRHRRHTPVEHAFTYAVGMLYLDLDELPDVLDAAGPLWSASRPAPGRFRRADHPGDPATPLKATALDLVEDRTGHRPDGPVRLLCSPRTFGRAFNPVTFTYCFGGDGATVEAVIAQVTNTPWRETHGYVMDARRAPDAARSRVLRAQLPKAFHVSPLQGMDERYTWALGVPGETLSVHIAADAPGERTFDATLGLHRRELDRAELTRLLARFPFTALRTLGLIYGQALRLRLRGVPWFAHPGVSAP